MIVGTGGWGGYWCQGVLPRLAELGKAVAVAAADVNPEALKNAEKHLKLALFAAERRPPAKMGWDELFAEV